MSQIIEIAIECSECGGMIQITITPETQVRELFKPCPACRVLAGIL